MEFLISAATDIGIAKQTNQDSFNVRVFNTPQGKISFGILCDGMGGLSKGEVASGSLVHAFCTWAEERLSVLAKNPILDDDLRREWSDLVIRYNEKIKEYGKQQGIRLGTTITAILLTETRYYIVNVGDSRAYEIQDVTKLLTKDQTLVAREVELGHITAEEALTDPRRNVLLQCVGASEFVSPDFFFGDTQQNAVYMLCSDGFRHEISNEEIYSYLNPDVMLDFNGMKQNMMTLIDINKQRQEHDNITVLAIRTY